MVERYRVHSDPYEPSRVLEELADAVTMLLHSQLGPHRLATIGRVPSALVCAAAAVLGT